MKKYYEKVSVTPLGISSESPLLDGSNTTKMLSVQKVTVEDYTYGFASDDKGFVDEGFEVGFGE